MADELSLYEQLSKSYDDYSGDDDTGKVIEGEVVDDKVIDDQKIDSASNVEPKDKAIEGNSGESKNIDDKVADESKDVNAEKLKAPEHWSAEDKAAFDGAPKSVQEWALRRDSQMNSDYTRKTEDIANFRKTWQPVNDLFSPHIARGVNPAAVIQNWASIAQNLESNPLETLKSLAAQYKIDLSSFTPKKNDDIWGDEKPTEVNDPRFSQLEQQLKQLTGHLQQRDQSERETRVKTFESKIREFSEQKTEAGAPAHPYFDELLPDMMALARAAQSSGIQPDLKDLYEKALWSNPSTREKTIASQQAIAAKKAEDEAIAKARKAQHASKSVGGGSQDSGSVSNMSIRELLESQF